MPRGWQDPITCPLNRSPRRVCGSLPRAELCVEYQQQTHCGQGQSWRSSQEHSAHWDWLTFLQLFFNLLDENPSPSTNRTVRHPPKCLFVGHTGVSCSGGTPRWVNH
uniref:Uncharacterized protein n=1 Tax=Knipowitschia caucasica TaxID=637954 RepID=A0AAV2JL03_KNICA